MADPRYRPGRALVLSTLLLLSACSVGEDYHRPEVAVPPSWNDGVASGEWPSAAWWRNFNAPGLDALVEEASRNNLDLAAAQAQVRQADAQIRISGGSLLPSVDLGGSASRSRSPGGFGGKSGHAGEGVYATQMQPALSASYEIDFWGKTRAAVEAAEATALGVRFNRQSTLLTVQAGVASTYFAVLGASDRLRVARANLANAEEVLAALRDKLRAGTATDLDVAQQEAQVAQTAAAIPPLEQSRDQSRNALAVLLGRLPQQWEGGPPVAGLGDIAAPVVPPGLPSQLLDRRPDVRYAEQQLVAANATITEAIAALFPSITLTGQYGFESTALNTLFQPASVLWSLGASLSQPIFRGGALQGAVELEEGNWDQLVATYRKAVISAFQDVENALVAYRKTSEEEAAQQRAESTARRAYGLALDQLRGGIVEITTVLEAQKTLYAAEDNLAVARLDKLQAAVGLYKALGGGWDGRG